MSDRSTMATEDERRLAYLEGRIARGLGTFVEVGEALTEIRDDKLYRRAHETFDVYCEKRWGFKRTHIYELMNASKVVAEMSAIADIAPPSNEAQARALTRLPTPEVRAEVWSAAVDTYGESVTAADVRRTAQALTALDAPTSPIVDMATGEVIGELRAATPEDEARFEAMAGPRHPGLPVLRETSEEERAFDRLVALSLITRIDPEATAAAAAQYRAGSAASMLARGPTVVAWYETFFQALQAELGPALRRVK